MARNPKMSQVNMQVPAELWKRVRIQAIQEGTNASEYVRRALRAKLEQGATPEPVPHG